MKSKIFITLFFISAIAVAQQNDASGERKARKLLREGNELYQQKKFADAEVAYKKALEKNTTYGKAIYNLGNALYQLKRDDESIQLFKTIANTTNDKNSKAEAYHNLGNSYMNTKQYALAVDAYKNALRNNSKDEETRYNLALAQKLQKEYKDKNNGQDQQQNQDKKDDQNQDQQQDKKENQDKKDDQKDKNDQKKEDNKDNQQQKQQPKPNQLSPQQMEQLLEAMNKEENKTQKKVNLQKAPNNPTKKEKDW